MLDRDTILQALWPGVFVSDDSIGQCVKDVRRALGEKAQHLVRTVPKRGYILEAPVSNVAADPPPLAARPSIAVLAFTNMTGDPEQEFFADGIAEDISSALSKSRSLFVISRSFSFKYKGKSTAVEEIGRELGVRYVLQGSVRKAGDRVRVTAQLIDAATAGYLWAERYDRDLSDIFALQDDIATTVYAVVQPALEQCERQRVVRRLPESLDAWESYHRGMWHYANPQAAELDLALDFLRRAIELDPRFALAYAVLAAGYLREAAYFRPEKRVENIARGHDYALRAVAIDSSDATGHAALAYALQMSGAHAESILEANLAVSLDPNSAYACGALGAVCAWGGRPSEAIGPVRTAIRLSPFDSWAFAAHGSVMLGHFQHGRYEEAAMAAYKAVQSNPGHSINHVLLAASLAKLDKIDAAKAAAARVLELHPTFRYSRQFSGVDCAPALAASLGEALRVAALPE